MVVGFWSIKGKISRIKCSKLLGSFRHFYKRFLIMQYFELENVCFHYLQCHNRVMFKQFLQAQALSYLQVDSCRLGSVNENLSVLLMAKKFQSKTPGNAAVTPTERTETIKIE